MYDPKGGYCPKHPTLPNPCQICATPSIQVDPNSPDNTLVQQVNWQAEAQIAYNTVAPVTNDYDPMLGLAERLGLDEHWDNPRDRQVPPPPTIPMKIPGL